ncbi:MAG: hypothetical protein R2764_15080 [Bacteroidales bacterium]
MPEITDTVKTSTMPPWLEGRSPFVASTGWRKCIYVTMLKENLRSLRCNCYGSDGFYHQPGKTNAAAKYAEPANRRGCQNDDTLFVDLSLLKI